MTMDGLMQGWMDSWMDCWMHGCIEVELSIMGAWKSLCKAFEHIATAFWPPCGWNATFCYTILSEQGAQRVDVGAR